MEKHLECAELAGLKYSEHLQGKSLVKTINDPSYKVRDMAFSITPRRGDIDFLLRTEKWAYIQYDEDAKSGIELFDMEYDPKQYNNLAYNPIYEDIVQDFQAKLKYKLKEIRNNDLEIEYDNSK